mmetsp:Transcript_27751/g.76384  ORF Transcript_27751/g.76384 Transcript_27751/m.76384 type:complete len:116 (-) Transcript_27751:80-427(-)|eukprot:CAMPEP_0168742782 /NCGR_PEP_ID=MMETSP0724-20121128/13218_1 /TAXON_ID=265536 /ORGANISM="Amphiprora sp., Strain CCMP467" /LENGTH=115 /DNA_ID=CAMNT_0008790351 /DNA_START=299 /DNA_END=649 /DNA_ORIENTATION=+
MAPPPSPAPTRITFFQTLVPLVASGAKTITIRDETESHYQPGTVVDVFPLEQPHQEIPTCRIRILAVEPLGWEDIDEEHVRQEGLASREQLLEILESVYPRSETPQLYLIRFELL